METMDLLKKVAKDLAVLEMPTDKVPAMEEVRKVYKGKLHLHPDNIKTGDGNKFKVISEAVRHIVEFLSEYPELQSDTDKDEFGTTIKYFEKANKVQYKSACIVFSIEEDMHETWMKVLKGRLGDPDTIPGGWIFRKNTWILPGGSQIFDNIAKKGLLLLCFRVNLTSHTLRL